MASKGKGKGRKGEKVPGARGGSLVGGIIKLALIGGAVYGVDTYVDDAWFSSSKKVQALIAAYPVTHYSTPRLRGFRNRCRKAASKPAEGRRCSSHYAKLSRESGRVMRAVRAARRGVSSQVRREGERCRRYRDSKGRAAHSRWQRDADRWYSDLSTWNRRGGDHPGVYLPPLPARCTKRARSSKSSSRARRRRR